MMENLERLPVIYEGLVVGVLHPDARGALSFQYSRQWLANTNAFPISYSLPLRKEIYTAAEAHPFFANLLPEGNLRIQLARSLTISESSDYQLLKEIGGECAGALQITPENSLNTEYFREAKEEKRILNDETLKKLILTCPSVRFDRF